MKSDLLNLPAVLNRARFVYISGAMIVFGFIAGFLMLADIQVASGQNRLGILGQPAPELDLNGWIDGDGKKMASVQLGDLKGKVVYLYFFQDW